MSVRLGVLLAAVFAAIAMLSPLLGVPVYGRFFGHDADFALTALRFMSDAWAEGDPWPRWVMDSNYGLGAATFYTYPPLAYWAGAALRRLTGLDIPGTLGLGMALWRGVFLLGCYAWLRRHAPPGPALAAAALAGLLPYAALVNPWIRFGYAEVAGTALLPFLLLAIERACEQRREAGLPALALGFAALALTHMPTCVLMAHLGPLYAWAYGGRRGALRCIAGGVAGAGLAACFVLPAFGLLPELSFHETSGEFWHGSLLFYGLPSGTVAWVMFQCIVWTAAI